MLSQMSEEQSWMLLNALRDSEGSRIVQVEVRSCEYSSFVDTFHITLFRANCFYNDICQAPGEPVAAISLFMFMKY